MGDESNPGKQPDDRALIESVFRVAPVGIGLVRRRVLERVNARVCEMVGYDAAELVGQSARILYPTEEDFLYVGEEKYRQISARGTGTVETRWQRKDGEIIDVLLSSTPLDLDDLDAGVTFSALDITDRRRAAEALELFRDDPRRFVLVMLDLTMPEMGGEETLTKLREQRSDVPVLLISGYGEQELADRIPQRRRVSFIQKPFHLGALAQKIRALLG